MKLLNIIRKIKFYFDRDKQLKLAIARAQGYHLPYVVEVLWYDDTGLIMRNFVPTCYRKLGTVWWEDSGAVNRNTSILKKFQETTEQFGACGYAIIISTRSSGWSVDIGHYIDYEKDCGIKAHDRVALSAQCNGSFEEMIKVATEKLNELVKKNRQEVRDKGAKSTEAAFEDFNIRNTAALKKADKKVGEQ